MNDNLYDVIIIGSGPAGLTAGIYAGRANLITVIIGGTSWGGQLMLTTDVENFPGFPKGVQGPKLMAEIREQAEKFGAKVVEEDVDGVDFANRPFKVTANNTTYLGQSVIIASGAATKWLELPSEKKLIGRGVSSCAPCDAPFFKDKEVIVVGGGDAAMEEATVLTKFAKKVTIVHRRAEFRASKIMQERVFANPKINIIWDSQVDEILGEEKVTGVKLRNIKTQEVTEMTTDGVFVAIGHMPATDIFQGKVNLDEKGYVRLNHKSGVGIHDEQEHFHHNFPSMTNIEGVFVSGDVHDHHYKQAITAAAYGTMAAMDASRWLENMGIGKGAAIR